MEEKNIAGIKERARELNIPVINGFEILKTDNTQTIFLAVDGQGFTQQLTGDSLLENETFETKINLVRDNVISFMRQNGDNDAENHYVYIKDYNNGVFNFKVYLQDLLFQGKAIRMLTAFFYEPRKNDFYQMSISVGPFPYPTTSFTIGKFDESKEPISSLLSSMMEAVLKELRYKQ